MDLTIRYCECLIAGSGRGSGGSDTAPDDSWIVRGPVSGGPEDGSVIPSFLGHVALSIWGGDRKQMNTCTAKHTLTHLRKWYECMDATARPMVD